MKTYKIRHCLATIRRVVSPKGESSWSVSLQWYEKRKKKEKEREQVAAFMLFDPEDDLVSLKRCNGRVATFEKILVQSRAHTGVLTRHITLPAESKRASRVADALFDLCLERMCSPIELANARTTGMRRVFGDLINMGQVRAPSVSPQEILSRKHMPCSDLADEIRAMDFSRAAPTSSGEQPSKTRIVIATGIPKTDRPDPTD